MSPLLHCGLFNGLRGKVVDEAQVCKEKMGEAGFSTAVPYAVVVNPAHLFIDKSFFFPKQHKAGESRSAVSCGSGVEKGEVGSEVVGVRLCAAYY